jgi:hypothetical protein
MLAGRLQRRTTTLAARMEDAPSEIAITYNPCRNLALRYAEAPLHLSWPPNWKANCQSKLRTG